jgi:SNF2 family DNA or RNA helicase
LITDTVEPLEGRSEKFDLVLERVEEILAAGEKVIVFSQFLNTLSLLQAALQARRVKHVRLDGSLSLSARQGRIDRLNEGDAQVALCSLQAVGHGVNLIGANHVIHIDRWWNPAIEDQATDRAHRIGQAKTVFVHLIQTRNTLEEKIAMLQERKRGLSDDIMSAAAQQGLQWTREELLEILQPLD